MEHEWEQKEGEEGDDGEGKHCEGLEEGGDGDDGDDCGDSDKHDIGNAASTPHYLFSFTQKVQLLTCRNYCRVYLEPGQLVRLLLYGPQESYMYYSTHQNPILVVNSSNNIIIHNLSFSRGSRFRAYPANKWAVASSRTNRHPNSKPQTRL